MFDFERLPILETERLRLEPLLAGDADDLFPIMGDPEVMAYWDLPEVDDPDLVATIVQSQVDAMAAGRALYWSMRTLDGRAFLGSCDLSEIDLWHRRAEVGFMLGREAWGQGYALEAMTTVVAFAASGGTWAVFEGSLSLSASGTEQEMDLSFHFSTLDASPVYVSSIAIIQEEQA